MKKEKVNVLSLLDTKTNDYASKVALGMKTGYGWKEFTYQGVAQTAKKLAAYFMNDLELKRGERMAILSESKPEFGACVFASVISGLITVPLDVKLTKYELISILSDCEPSVITVSQHHLSMALELQKELPSLKHVILMDESTSNLDVLSIYDLHTNTNCKWRHRSKSSTVFIIYTSGTTGSPKGVEISFGNMLAQIEDLQPVLDKILPFKDVRTLSILPMNHLFEMTVGFTTLLNRGYSVYYSQSLKPKDIMNSMQDKKIQFMIVVPAFLKLLKTSIEADIKSCSELSQKMFEFKYHLTKFIPFVSIKRLLFKKIHKKFGGEFLGFIVGGAPLDVAVGKFFERLGINIHQGYGLSETSPVVSINCDKKRDMASVGRALKGYDVRIDDETGELLLKGPSVMKGYHNQPELTASVFTKDGYLHTGDIAKIEKGHIFITGRIKNMIVLSGGKKVFPEEVEAVLEKSDYFAEVCVLGVSRTFGSKNGTEDIVAIIVPTQELINKYDDATLDKVIKDEVKRLSLRLTPYKRPINIVVHKELLPRTSTRKVKRKEVLKLLNV